MFYSFQLLPNLLRDLSKRFPFGASKGDAFEQLVSFLIRVIEYIATKDARQSNALNDQSGLEHWVINVFEKNKARR